VYGNLAYGPLKGVPIAGLVGDQQAALIGNKCLSKGEAKCTYGTGAFLLFCTGGEVVKSGHGLLSTVRVMYYAFFLEITKEHRRSHTKQARKQNLYTLLRAVVSLQGLSHLYNSSDQFSVAVAGSAIKWLRDSMKLISSAAEINTLAASVPSPSPSSSDEALSSSSGLYFVPAFSGLLAPYWDPGAAGLIIGLSFNTEPAHIARAVLEANAFQTRAIVESMKLDAQGTEMSVLKVDGGMTNGDLAMQVLADLGGFSVVRPEMREYVFRSML